jgi:hypothetical protein
VPGAVWRSCAARGAFCRAGEGELRRQKGGDWRRDDWQLWILIWVIEGRK